MTSMVCARAPVNRHNPHRLELRSTERARCVRSARPQKQPSHWSQGREGQKPVNGWFCEVMASENRPYNVVEEVGSQRLHASPCVDEDSVVEQISGGPCCLWRWSGEQPSARTSGTQALVLSTTHLVSKLVAQSQAGSKDRHRSACSRVAYRQ